MLPENAACTTVDLVGDTHEELEWKLAEFVTRGKVPLPI